MDLAGNISESIGSNSVLTVDARLTLANIALLGHEAVAKNLNFIKPSTIAFKIMKTYDGRYSSAHAISNLISI